jgi:hypothetical protein
MSAPWCYVAKRQLDPGRADAVIEGLFAGYFTNGRDVGDRPVLMDIAVQAGLNRAKVEVLLAGHEGAEECSPAMEKRYLHEKLMSGDPTVQKLYFRMMLAAGAALLTLHIAVAASVIPYVYVDDPMANCGARLILERFGSDVYTIAGLIAATAFATTFYRWFWVLPPPPPDIRLFRWSKPLLAGLSGALITVSLIYDGLISISDIDFLRKPPVVERNALPWRRLEDQAAAVTARRSPRLRGGAPAPLLGAHMAHGHRPRAPAWLLLVCFKCLHLCTRRIKQG